MELLVLSKLSHLKFHGIPWNCSCHRNWRTPSSMEFHGTFSVSEFGALLVPWNSMEFHGTARVIEIGALGFPWISTELLVSTKLAHLKFHEFHEIPWHCSCYTYDCVWLCFCMPLNLCLCLNHVLIYLSITDTMENWNGVRGRKYQPGMTVINTCWPEINKKVFCTQIGIFRKERFWM